MVGFAGVGDWSSEGDRLKGGQTGGGAAEQGMLLTSRESQEGSLHGWLLLYEGFIYDSIALGSTSGVGDALI